MNTCNDSKDNDDEPLLVDEAAAFVKELTSGRMFVVELLNNGVALCERGKIGGFRLLPYQMTRKGLRSAVDEARAV